MEVEEGIGVVSGDGKKIEEEVRHLFTEEKMGSSENQY